MVAAGNQWYPRRNSDGSLKLWDNQPPIMGRRPQNMPLTFYYHPLNQ